MTRGDILPLPIPLTVSSTASLLCYRAQLQVYLFIYLFYLSPCIGECFNFPEIPQNRFTSCRSADLHGSWWHIWVSRSFFPGSSTEVISPWTYTSPRVCNARLKHLKVEIIRTWWKRQVLLYNTTHVNWKARTKIWNRAASYQLCWYWHKYQNEAFNHGEKRPLKS